MTPSARRRQVPLRIPFEEVALLAMLALVPIVFSRATEEVFETPKVALLATGALLLAGRALASELSRVARSGVGAYLREAPARVRSGAAQDPLGVAVLLFLGSAGVSTVTSPNPGQSLYGATDSPAGLVTALSTAAIYFASRGVSPGQTAALVRYARAAGLAAAVASSYALLQLAGIDPLIWARTATFGGALRVFGTLGHPNMLGAYLAMTAPLTIWLAMRTKSTAERILWAFVTLASVVVIAGTLSRGAWLALAAAALTGLILGWWTRKSASEDEISRHREASRASPAPLLPIAGVAALLVVAAAVFLFRASVGPHITERARQIASLSAPTSRSRLFYWKTGLRMAHDHPWVGVGLDAFGTAFPRYRTPAYWELEWGGLPEKAHNDAVQTLATQGIPGSVAAFLVVVLAARATLRRLGRGDAASRAGAVAAVASLVAFVVQGLMGFTVVALGSLAAALAGWVTSDARSGRAGGTVQPSRGGPPGKVALLLAGISMAGLFMALVVSPLRTQIHAKAALRAPEGSAERVQTLEQVAREAPWDARYPHLLGASLLTEYQRDPRAANGRELLRRAAQAERTAIEIEPWNGYHYAGLGRVELAQASLQPPEATGAGVSAAFLDAVAREPDNPRLMEQASQALSQFGQRAEARAMGLRAAKGYSNLGQPMAFLGYEALLDGRWKDAADTLEIALRREWHTETATRAAAYANLAVAYLQLGRNEEALRAAEEGLRVDPANAQAAANRKLAVERLGTSRSLKAR